MYHCMHFDTKYTEKVTPYTYMIILNTVTNIQFIIYQKSFPNKQVNISFCIITLDVIFIDTLYTTFIYLLNFVGTIPFFELLLYVCFDMFLYLVRMLIWNKADGKLSDHLPGNDCLSSGFTESSLNS